MLLIRTLVHVKQRNWPFRQRRFNDGSHFAPLCQNRHIRRYRWRSHDHAHFRRVHLDATIERDGISLMIMLIEKILASIFSNEQAFRYIPPFLTALRADDIIEYRRLSRSPTGRRYYGACFHCAFRTTLRKSYPIFNEFQHHDQPHRR